MCFFILHSKSYTMLLLCNGDNVIIFGAGWRQQHKWYWQCLVKVIVCQCIFCLWCGSFPSCSAYTEAYKVCTVAAAPQIGHVADVRETMGEEDQGRTSDEEDGALDISYDRQVGSPACWSWLMENNYWTWKVASIRHFCNKILILLYNTVYTTCPHLFTLMGRI